MCTTQQLTITLSNEMAEAVRLKISSGEYSSESEVICDGLRALLACDRMVEPWLRGTVVPATQALKDDPRRVISINQVREHFEARRGTSRAKP